jgi:hypothetical protein
VGGCALGAICEKRGTRAAMSEKLRERASCGILRGFMRYVIGVMWLRWGLVRLRSGMAWVRGSRSLRCGGSEMDMYAHGGGDVDYGSREGETR